MRDHPEIGRDDASLLPDPLAPCGCDEAAALPSSDSDGAAYCMNCDQDLPANPYAEGRCLRRDRVLRDRVDPSRVSRVFVMNIADDLATARSQIAGALSKTKGVRDPRNRDARIETGRRRLSAKTLRAAARSLDCEVECIHRRYTRYEGIICEWLVYSS